MSRKALLIGIDDYPGMNKLTGCVNDAQKLASVLGMHQDGSRNFHVKLLKNVYRSSDVMLEVQNLFKGEHEVALFYFAGHGYANTTGAEIVLPQDIMIDGQYYTGIQLSDIMTIVNNSNAKNKVVILDCCRSGNIEKYLLNNVASQMFPGVTVMTACQGDEEAIEIDNRGIFTTLLCEALEGRAANIYGSVTIGSVYSYIDEQLGPWDPRPDFKANVSSFVELRKTTPKVRLDNLRSLTKYFEHIDSEIRLDPSFEYTNVKGKEGAIEPYADEENTKKFQVLQTLNQGGLVEPVEEEFMYFAAMHNKACRLTQMGQRYWQREKKEEELHYYTI